MRVRVRLDGSRPRRWHVALLARIGAMAGIDAVGVDASPGPARWPDNADLLFRLEALVHGLPRESASQVMAPAALDPWRAPDAAPDLTIDLCGDVAAGIPVWRPLFDGSVGEPGLLASLLAGRTPRFALAADGRVLVAGRIGTDRPGIVRAAFDDGLARTATLIAAALSDRITGRGAPGTAADPAPAARDPGLPAARLGALAGTMLARSVVHRLYRLCYRAPHWRTGWRRLDGPDLIDLGRHPAGGWSVLPDDGRRFYADPFPLVFAGTTHVFVEDFPHATGKGIISAVRVGPDGPAGRPEPVLEEAHHLSYPFVFERDGAAWMVPESCATGTVELYRATAFPGGWVREATLLSGVVASDATLLEHAGRWWLFATVRDARPGERRVVLRRAAHLVGPRFPRTLHAASGQPGAGRSRPRAPRRADRRTGRPADTPGAGLLRGLRPGAGAGADRPPRRGGLRAGRGRPDRHGRGLARQPHPHPEFRGRDRVHRRVGARPALDRAARALTGPAFRSPFPWRRRHRAATLRERGCRVRQEHYPRGLIDSLGSCPWPRPWTWSTRFPPTL